VIKSNRKYFDGSPPEKFVDMRMMKKKHVAKRDHTKKHHAKLLWLKNQAMEQKKATIYYDRKGLQSVMELILKQKASLLAFGAEGRFQETFGPYWENFNRRREKLKIPVRISIMKT